MSISISVLISKCRSKSEYSIILENDMLAVCSMTINAVFILFKLFFEILKFSCHWKEMLREGIYEQTFILYLGARKEDTSARRAWEKLRGKNAKYFA